MLKLAQIALLLILATASVHAQTVWIIPKSPSGARTLNEGGDVPVQVTIDKDGSISCNSILVCASDDHKFTALIERLKSIIAANSSQPILVTPLSTTPHQRVMEVLNVCITAGVKELALDDPAHQPPPTIALPSKKTP